jgi:hypothetical protein
MCRFWMHPSNWWVVLKSTHLLVGFLLKIWMLGNWFNHASISVFYLFFVWQVTWVGGFVIFFCGIGRDELQDKKGWAGWWCLYIYAPSISPTQLNSLLGLQVVAMAFRWLQGTFNTTTSSCSLISQTDYMSFF